MKRFLRENGLSLVCFGLFFVVFLFGQTIAGERDYNDNQREHGHAEVSYLHYLTTPHFLEATMENWESEFLQMFVFVVLTTFLYQKGSAESKKPDEQEEVDRDPRLTQDMSQAPWPVRKGGFVLTLYQNSLSLVFLVLFLLALGLHAVGGAGEYSQEEIDHGGQQVSALEYALTSRFWFESFQNWQSEFLAIGSMVVLSIWLRQKGSPESKPVDAPHSQTGKD